MKGFVIAVGLLVFSAHSAIAQVPTSTKTVNGKRYTFLRGAFTQAEAWREAERRAGKPVVFETLLEHEAVVRAFGLGRSDKDIAWTGHYQLPQGREPGLGWTTYGGTKSAPINMLFNSNGPDDGIRNKWGWSLSDAGLEIYYGPSSGKNEDGGVIWKDNNGLLEDVSINQRASVVIEF